MKTLVKTALPLILASALFPAICQASNQTDARFLAARCESTARLLMELVNQREKYDCAGEITIAATHTSVAAIQIERSKYLHAHGSLLQAKHELDTVREASERCAYYAPKVTPFVATLVRLNGELDVLARFALQNK